jgi:GrpE
MNVRTAPTLAASASVLLAAIALFREETWDLLSVVAVASCVVTACLAYLVAVPGGKPAARPEPSRADDGAWTRLVEEDVELIDELDRHRGGLDASGRAVADHVTSRLEEVLDRAGVEVIEADVAFDRLRHAPLDSNGVPKQGTAIAEVVSSGFAIGDRVLRRAHVRLRS